MAFHETVFPFALMYGMNITLRYKTSIVTTQSLHEERMCAWLDCLRDYSITPVLFDRADFQELGQFFRARSGRTNAFRLYDPIDHTLNNQSIGVGNDSRTIWQVYKSYQSGLEGDTYSAKRPVLKLIDPVVISVNNVVRTFPKVDLNLGLIYFQVTLTPISVSYILPNILRRNDGGNFQNDGVLINDRVVTTGGSSLNGSYLVNGFAEGGVSLTFATAAGVPFPGAVDTTALISIPPPILLGTGVPVHITCEFHTPVRFSSNRLGTSHATFQQYNPNGVQLIEDRLQPVVLSDSNLIELPIPGFAETRYPFHLQLSDDSEFSSRYSDQLITFDSGFEQRLQRSKQGVSDYELKYEIKPLEEIQRVVAFYHCRKGRYGGFRLKDINDYEVSNQIFGISDGETYRFQLVKDYESGGVIESRTITKPVSGTVVIYSNGNPLTLLTEHISIDYTTGEVEYFLGNLFLTIDAGLKTFTRIVGSWIEDGLVNGDHVVFTGTTVNTQVFTVSGVTPTVLTVTETVAAETAKTLSVYLPPIVGQTLSWSGEFDLPGRFNTDGLQISINGFESYNADNISFQEIHTEPIEVIYNDRPLAAVGALTCAGKASPLLSAPDMYLNFGSDGGGQIQLSYSEAGGSSTELHKAMKGITGLTFFAVISHSKRGAFFDIPQTGNTDHLASFDGDSIYPKLGIGILGLRVFIRNQPTDKACLFVETWCGSEYIVPGPENGCVIGNGIVRSGRLPEPLYVHPETEEYEPTTIVIVTISYSTGRVFVSGTKAGMFQLSTPAFANYVCSNEGVRVEPAERYMNGIGLGYTFFGSIVGGYSPSIVNQVVQSGGPLGRVYEMYFGQYYEAVQSPEMEVVTLQNLHNVFLEYLEAKYLYRRKAALAVPGTRGHFLVTPESMFTVIAAPPPVFLPSVPGDNVGKWVSDRSVGAMSMVSYSPQSMFPPAGPKLRVLSPDHTFLTGPLKGFWE